MSKKHKVKKPAVQHSESSKDLSPKVYQRDKIDFNLSIRERSDLTDKQWELIDLILDKKTQIVFLSGPAGTSKSFVSVMAGLMLLNSKSVSDILYIRSIAESASKSLGSLPGEIGAKIEPFLMPLMDKLDELLPKAEVNKLLNDERVTGTPVNYLRGASFNARFIFCDECQNLSVPEAVTVLTRLGKHSKLIMAGDPMQSDIHVKSGFNKLFDLFNDESSKKEGIHCFSFTREDIVRSGILKYIIERLEGQESAKVKSEPMFESK